MDDFTKNAQPENSKLRMEEKKAMQALADLLWTLMGRSPLEQIEDSVPEGAVKSMNPNFLYIAKQVKETKDHKEAALLVQSGDWVIVNAAFQGDDILWALIRV